MQLSRQNATSIKNNLFKFNENNLISINNFFKKNTTFIRPSFNNTSYKTKFIEEIQTKLNKKKLKLFDVNYEKKGCIVRIEINDNDENIINYYYNDNPSNIYNVKIDDFIKNIYYNKKYTEMFLSFKNFNIHLPEYSKIDNIEIIYRDIIDFFEEINFSLLNESDKSYILTQIKEGNELNKIINDVKILEIDKDKSKKIKKYEENFYYLTRNNKLSIEINKLSNNKYTANPIFTMPINKQYFIAAGNIRIKKISINNNNNYEYDTEIILTKNEIEIIENYMNKKYDIIKEELDKIRMPPPLLSERPSKRIKVNGGKSLNKLKRQIYKNDKGKLYIKYDKNTIIYLSI